MTQTQEQQGESERIVDGRYRVRREIARGGHGVVREAEHLVTHGRVAIKTLVESARAHPAAGPRLIREAQILAALRHPNVVSVHDAGTCPIDGPYVAFELIEGRPLDGILLARHRLPVGQTVALVLQLCEALSEVHRHGVIHRDVKTGNLLVAPGIGRDHVTLIDFGIGKVVASDANTHKKITQGGELVGTIEYMAPEQIAATSPVDARADIYSTGMIIYECLVGEVAYTGAPTEVIANMFAAGQLPSIRSHRRDVPLALEAVVRQACEIDPSRRFASAAELGRACVAALGSPVPVLNLLDASRARDDAAGAYPDAAPADAGRSEQNLRRQYARAPYVTPVRVLMGTRTTDGRTEDLSEGGVLIITDIACADGERVKIRLPLPLSGRVVEVEAIARWTKARRNQGAVGAEFVDAPEDVRAEIRAYVALMTDAAAAARPRV